MIDKANVPPHDELLENALLAGVITYPEEFSKIEAYLSNGHTLYQFRAKALWRLIRRMRMDGEEVSLPTICASISASDEKEGLNR